MPPTLPPFVPMRVHLVGHHDLGTVQARWLGCLLEVEHGPTYGPCAVFSAQEVEAEPPRASSAVDWAKDGPWTLVSISVESSPVATPEPLPPIERLRYKQRMVEWRGCTLHVRHVPGWWGYLAAVFGDGAWSTCSEPEHAAPNRSGMADEQTVDAAKDAAIRALLAAGVLTVEAEPAPKPDRTVYDPNDIQRCDRHFLRDGSRGTVLCVHDGWIAYTDRLPVIQHCDSIIRVDPYNEDDVPF